MRKVFKTKDGEILYFCDKVEKYVCENKASLIKIFDALYVDLESPFPGDHLHAAILIKVLQATGVIYMSDLINELQK